MKSRVILSLGLAVLAGVSLVPPALAVTMSWTSIGNANNAADTTGYGSVNHAYNIGTYEVTNAQYVEFLNAKGSSNSAGIYNATMGTTGAYGSNIVQGGSSGSYTYSVSSTYANMPVVGVTWFDAARFSNWLGNGQGNGDMETGAYTLNGATSGNAVDKNSTATVYIPSENEWYKAAYYNGTTSTYSLYPNGQNSITTAEANCDFSVGHTTAVGTYSGAASSYGTFDQGGNAWEWNDLNAVSGSSRGLRGGSWINNGLTLASSSRYLYVPSLVSGYVGFRVASVPEPSAMVLTIFASGMMLTRRKR